jgi:transposase-like protein
MVAVRVQCPQCQSVEVVKYGKQANRTRRYRCQNRDGVWRIFLVTFNDRGRLPPGQQQIVDIAFHGSRVRVIVRVLWVSSATMIATLKKKASMLHPVNTAVFDA